MPPKKTRRNVGVTISILKIQRFRLSNAEKVSKEWLAIPHHIFLGTKEDMNDIAKAFLKIKEAYS